MTIVLFHIRTAQPRDEDAILALWGTARSAHASTADAPEDVQRLLSQAPSSLLVADWERVPVGVLIAAWDGWRGNMYRLAVSPEYRRQGIGVALVRAGEERLRYRGARRITALVAYEDARAAAFWDAAGYPQDHEIGRRVRNL